MKASELWNQAHDDDAVDNVHELISAAAEYDREHAWPFYSYVIASVAQGKPVDMTSWVLDDQTQTFSRQDIVEE